MNMETIIDIGQICYIEYDEGKSVNYSEPPFPKFYLREINKKFVLTGDKAQNLKKLFKYNADKVRKRRYVIL